MNTKIFLTLLAYLILSVQLYSQVNNRIQYNNQSLFLNGVNMAWMSFANDIGPSPKNYEAFEEFFLTIHDSGGNAVRWWLHTNGTVTPQFDENNFVISMGEGTIRDLKKILDIAWEREVGVILCLWSFDMLRKTNSTIVKTRNTLLLTDTNYTRAYINNCLIPMVDSLKGHPAIIAWEIFNEPEGMSNEFGWSDIEHVPMSAIQRFINLCAGAIHKTDTTAKVTSGAWSFKALTDEQISASLRKEMSREEKMMIASFLKQHYQLTASTEEIAIYLDNLATMSNYNYYRDDRLIDAGGDSEGILDFYCVHYYSGTGPSPFRNAATAWGLTKPIVVAEFHITDTDGIPKNYLYPTLYASNYAGALAWSWTDNTVSQKNDMLQAIRFMWNNYRNDVDVEGISGDWPGIVLTKPQHDEKFNSGETVIIEADAWDNDGTVAKVEFYVNKTELVAVDSVKPYIYEWSGMSDGYYTIHAVVYDNQDNRRKSNSVKILVGTPPLVRYEAEAAIRVGTGMSVKSSADASGGAYVDVATNETGTKIIWIINNVLGAGNFDITFGYNLNYDTPKGQYINVNGVRIGELMFDGVTKVWLEKSINVPLRFGSNSIEMEMSWGWMYVDYLAVPSEVVTSVKSAEGVPASFYLMQNYPNPFNPLTTVEFQLAQSSYITLTVYDLLGREVVRLIDEKMQAGKYQVQFEAHSYASGMYFLRMMACDNGKILYSSTKKIHLLK